MIIHIASSHLLFESKKQSYHFRKVKPDDKGGNRLTLSYNAREKPSSWERLRKDFFGLFPKESLTVSTLSEHLAVNFLPDLGFSAFLLRLFIDSVVLKFVYLKINLAFLWITVKSNFLRNFACTVLNDFVSK